MGTGRGTLRLWPPWRRENSGSFLLISRYEKMHTYLGVSHLNSYGSPQTPKCPFHWGWSNACYMVVWCQGSITNILKDRAKFCTAFPQKRPIHRNDDGAVYLTQLKFGCPSRNQKKKSWNNKRMIIMLFTILASECIGWTWGEAQGLLRFGPCIPRRLEFTDICLSI